MEILRLNEKNRQMATEKSVADATSRRAIGLLLAYKGEKEGSQLVIWKILPL